VNDRANRTQASEGAGKPESMADRRRLEDELVAGVLGVPAHLIHRRRRRGLLFMLVACVMLIPWIAVLAVTLPEHYEAADWKLTWVGFDGALFVLLAATVYLAWRRRQAVAITAFTAAVMLVCDAWFDLTTAATQTDFRQARAAAVFIELPLAYLLARGAWMVVKVTIVAVEPGLDPRRLTLRALWRSGIQVRPGAGEDKPEIS
jgi:hypothetical protein